MMKLIIALRYLSEGILKRGSDSLAHEIREDTSVLGGKRLTSRPSRFGSRKEHRHQLNSRIIESRCGNMEKRKKSLLPCRDSKPFSSRPQPSRYTDYAIPSPVI